MHMDFLSDKLDVVRAQYAQLSCRVENVFDQQKPVSWKGLPGNIIVQPGGPGAEDVIMSTLVHSQFIRRNGPL